MKKLFLAVPVAALALVAVTAGAAAQPAPAREHLFVAFGKAPGAAERALVQRYGGTVRFSFPEVNALAIDLSSAKVGDLARESGVRYVEQDPERRSLQLDKNQLVPSLSNGLYGLVTTRAVDAHANGFNGAGVKACVADTGLDTDHPDIAGNFVAGVDIIDNDSDPNTGNDPFETHATHVAGILLGVNNGVGIYGVAYGAKEYHARVLADPDHDGIASGTTSQVMAGVEALAEQFGCRVINMSLGGGRRSGTEENLYKQITANGTLIVAAAGNSGVNKLDFPGGYPVVLSVAAVDRNNVIASFSSFGRGLDLSAPGVDVLSSVPNGTGREAKVSTSSDFEANGMEFAGTTAKQGVSGPLVHCGLAETAADCVGEPATGKWVALISRGTFTFNQKVTSAMAAGASAAIVYNNVAGNFNGTLGAETPAGGGSWIPAVSVSQADGATLEGQIGQTATVFNLPADWDFNSGTSMATPHVSGVAALVFGANPSLTPAGVEQILESTAKDLGTPGYDTTYGFGIPQADAAVAAATAP